MIRDFTETEKTKLLGYVQQEEAYNDGRLFGQLIDRIDDGRSYDGLDINDYLNDLDDFHIKLIDKDDYSCDVIEKLFATVGAVDLAYNTELVTLQSLMLSINTAIRNLKSLVNVNSNMPGNTKLFLDTSQFKDELNEVSEGLIDYYYSLYVTEKPDGTTEINFDAVKAFFSRDVNDVQPSEYAAMIKITDTFILENSGEGHKYRLDIENIERFIECAYIYTTTGPEKAIDNAQYIMKEADLSPVYEKLCDSMKLRSYYLIDYSGDILNYNNNECLNDETECYLRVETLKTSLFSAISTNLSHKFIYRIEENSLKYDDINDVENWVIDLEISEIKSYSASALPDYNITLNGEDENIRVCGLVNDMDMVTKEANEDSADMIYIDIDKMIIEDTTKEIASMAIGFVADEVPVPGLGDVISLGEFVFEETEKIQAAELSNQTVGGMVENTKVNMYSDHLCIGGVCANIYNGRVQVLFYTFVDEDALQQKVDDFNANSGNGYTITKEQLISCYETYVQGGGESEILIEFVEHFCG